MCKATVSSHCFFQSQGDFLLLRPSTQQRERDRQRVGGRVRRRKREAREELGGEGMDGETEREGESETGTERKGG